MSSAPLAPDADLQRLLDEGYDVVLQANHLVVRRVPYVDTEGAVRYGCLTYPVTVTGDRIVTQTDHRIWFCGTRPCNERGEPFVFATPEAHEVDEDLRADFMLSCKPPSGAFDNEYDKVTTYVRIVAHEARTVDESVTVTPGAAWQDMDTGQPFYYRDTATSRAGLSVLSRCFNAQRVVIIGLGGTGSYILDQVAKTPVESIVLLDGDTFDNHNAFRSPGAPTLDTLRERPSKVDYFAELYSHMHTSITSHTAFLDGDNLDLLQGATFVFLASDDAATKPVIIAWLEDRDIPFIDAGMGIEEVDGHLTGLLRVTTSLPGRRDAVHTQNRIPAPAPERDDYGRNIQVADLNAMNAVMAVMRWKRHLGYYADATDEGFSTYSVYANEIANEDDA